MPNLAYLVPLARTPKAPANLLLRRCRRAVRLREVRARVRVRLSNEAYHVLLPFRARVLPSAYAVEDRLIHTRHARPVMLAARFLFWAADVLVKLADAMITARYKT